jgi:hypothetical protein
MTAHEAKKIMREKYGFDKAECRWKEDENGNYDTSCGEGFILYAGTPEENKIKFCCYCGKMLKQELFDEGRE